jgi:hypothetical protein
MVQIDLIYTIHKTENNNPCVNNLCMRTSLKIGIFYK